MAIIKKIKLPNEATARDIGALSSNIIYDGDAGATTALNSKIQSIFTAIGNINSFDIQVVSSLPSTGASHTFYFVPQSQGATTHDEYMYIDDHWELIGTTTIDLSDYALKSEIVTYSLSMSGPTITLSPSSGTASTITLPIYDGTVV